MRSSRGQVPLLRTLWALGTLSLLVGSLLVAVASFLVPIPMRAFGNILIASSASFLIHAWLTKQEKN